MLTIVKKNDSYDAITYQLENEDNSTVDLTGANVNFVMGKKNKLITNAKAIVTSATSGIVSYQLTQLDTLVSGTFLAEFVVTFANGTVKTYPSNGYITVDVEQNLDTSQANVVVDMIAEKQGDFTSKLNSILQQAGNINMSAMNEYSWTATEGQLIFIFPSSVNYTPSTKWFQVSVGNVPVDNTLVNRSYDNQFALNIDSSNIKAGMTVRAMWVEPITPVVPNSYKIIPQQDLPPVDAGEGDLWFDTSDNTYQGTIFDDLNTRVSNNETSLADKASQTDLNTTNANVTKNASKLYLTPEDYGAVGDGIADDTTPMKNLLANNQNTQIKFGKNKTYKVTQIIDMGQSNNVEIDGNGSTLSFIVSSISTNFNIGVTTSYKTMTVNLTVDKGYTSIDLTGQDLTNITVGDIAVFSADVINGYTNAETVEITAINGNIVSFSSFIDTQMVITQIKFYKSSNKINIKNLSIQSSSANAITFIIGYTKNVKMENCKAIGNGSRIGFAFVYCINGYLANNSAYGYYDNNLVDNRTGYGFSVDSNNFYILNSNTKNCKHHLTIASKIIKSHLVVFDSFSIHANDSDCTVFWAHADFHGDAVDCKFINGTVHISKDFVNNNNATYDCAFSIRGKRCGVENCTIVVPDTFTNYYAACFHEFGTIGSFFRNNKVIGAASGISVKTSDGVTTPYALASDMDITNNTGLGNLNIGDLTNTLLQNIKISNNNIVGLINFVGCSQNVIIDKNILDCSTGQTAAHNDIRPHYKSLTNPVMNGKNIVVSNNVVNHGALGGVMVWNSSVAPMLITGNTMYATGGSLIYNDATNGTLVQKTNNFIYNDSTFVAG